MTPIQARSPYTRWFWISAGSLVAVIFLALLAAPRALATSHDQGGTDPGPAADVPATTVVRHPISVTAVAQQMQTAVQAASPGSTVGIDVVDLSTGAALASLNADESFYTASVVKLLIALDAMEKQNWQPDSDTAAQIQQMLSASDDDIADTLWVENGGGDIVTRMANLIGLAGTSAPSDPGRWGETVTTPRDVVTILQYIDRSIPESARSLVLDALHDTTQISADGTDQYFGIPTALPGSYWAVKQGWMFLDTSTTLDTTGLIAPAAGRPFRYAVAVLSTQPADTDQTAGATALTAGVTILHHLLQN